ncbi:PLP-dependent aminotransferase family protein [Veillonellaceae bacterium WCA-693-APC-5D-A]|uniref:PLP-dependent aminotransferase family protein n=1 Tax=Anaerovibrio slackiae TaxID=2652309 RepID=A0A6I2U834_9FIRM|nr:PLP-dependent aminotransferase family protein [Anaerovibrio slackiae]MSU07663.1 PLP-dependent aminotransferase family protein [Anaerovibrio slackiae]
MLTLELHKNKSTPLYMQIYSYIKSEVLARRLKAGTKLPSKRALAAQLGISTITIEGAYGQLMAEGYIYAKAKSGYYISPLESIQQADDSAADFFQHNTLGDAQLFSGPEKISYESGYTDNMPGASGTVNMAGLSNSPSTSGIFVPSSLQSTNTALSHASSEISSRPSITSTSMPSSSTISSKGRMSHERTAQTSCATIDLSSNNILPESFPFSIWTKLMRHTMSENQALLLTKSPTAGIYSLRCAIAEHLLRFRGMHIQPEQIIIGAGTEYLYELIIKLIGRDKIYCVEDPGYHKLQRIYTDNGACCFSLPIDQQGMSVTALNAVRCDVIHISPSHHFPTGIITPVSRRYELLGWATSGQRYIIEDDYDTEFRLVGKPIPSLFSMDMSSKVIYMNTFSKSLTSTIRISYMVLPMPLMEEFNRRLGYLSCTVSTFEQYTLAEFINQGYFERHINRMRNNYKKLRQLLLKELLTHPEHDKIQILQQASGLYFLLKINTTLSDRDLRSRLQQNGVHLQSLQHYYQNRQAAPEHTFVVNYSSLTEKDIPRAVAALFESLTI